MHLLSLPSSQIDIGDASASSTYLPMAVYQAVEASLVEVDAVIVALLPSVGVLLIQSVCALTHHTMPPAVQPHRFVDVAVGASHGPACCLPGTDQGHSHHPPYSLAAGV